MIEFLWRIPDVEEIRYGEQQAHYAARRAIETGIVKVDPEYDHAFIDELYKQCRRNGTLLAWRKVVKDGSITREIEIWSINKRYYYFERTHNEPLYLKIIKGREMYFRCEIYMAKYVKNFMTRTDAYDVLMAKVKELTKNTELLNLWNCYREPVEELSEYQKIELVLNSMDADHEANDGYKPRCYVDLNTDNCIRMQWY